MLKVEPLGGDDHDWSVAHLEEVWHSRFVARRGELLDASRFPGFVAWADGKRVGLLTYSVVGTDFEVLSVSVDREGIGVGRALMAAARSLAEAHGCERMWLITTNNNVRAFRFYQRWGMDLVGLHRDAVRESRRLKPEIPEADRDGVPIAHELEFELRLR